MDYKNKLSGLSEVQEHRFSIQIKIMLLGVLVLGVSQSSPELIVTLSPFIGFGLGYLVKDLVDTAALIKALNV
jgi:hypothetical protein